MVFCPALKVAFGRGNLEFFFFLREFLRVFLVRLLIICQSSEMGVGMNAPKFPIVEWPAMANELPTHGKVGRIQENYQRLLIRHGFTSLDFAPNRSHLILLPAEWKFAEFPCQFQFMVMLSSPESEDIFSAIKVKIGSYFHWRGSGGDRWHSLSRTGLKNATGTNLEKNGSGFARVASISWGYSHAVGNKSGKSMLRKTVQMDSVSD
jgi:hypothetical protein